MPRKSKTPCEDGRITQFSTIKVRLYPDAAQALLFERTFGCCRYIWNQMLSDQQRFYAETGAHFIPTPAKYKNGAPFLKEVDDQALIQEHNKLSQAFRVFFKNPESFGYPNFKRKKDDRDSFTACNHVFGSGPTIYTTRDGIRMTKAGIVRAKFHRRPGPVPSAAQSITGRSTPPKTSKRKAWRIYRPRAQRKRVAVREEERGDGVRDACQDVLNEMDFASTILPVGTPVDAHGPGPGER